MFVKGGFKVDLIALASLCHTFLFKCDIKSPNNHGHKPYSNVGKNRCSKPVAIRRSRGGGKEMIVKAMGVREMGGKATGARVSQETGGKGEMLMRERDPDNSLPPSDKAAGQTVMEGIHRKSYSEAVIEGVRKRVRVFVGDSLVRKTES